MEPADIDRVIAQALQRRSVNADQPTTADEMTTTAVAIRDSLLAVGADTRDLAHALGGIITRILESQGMSAEEKRQTVLVMAAGFEFEVGLESTGTARRGVRIEAVAGSLR